MLLEFMSSAVRAARSRFRNTGILANTIYRYRKKSSTLPAADVMEANATTSGAAAGPAELVPGTEPAGYSPPDFRVLSNVIPPDIAPLAQQYADRAVHLVPLGELVARQDAIIAATILDFFQSTTSLRGVTLDQIKSHIADFRPIYLNCPITHNAGGANFTTALNIYMITRCLAPTLVVECGVFKGASSYFLKAASPQARQFSYDPNLAQVVHRTPGVNYSNHDWMRTYVACDTPGTGLCYFDDHQSHATRIIQAHARGFRHVIVDDAWPIEVPGSGWPPIPSVDMILDNWMKVGESARWIEGTQMWTYTQTEETYRLMETARGLVKGAYDMPSLYRQTGVAPTASGKYVELV